QRRLLAIVTRHQRRIAAPKRRKVGLEHLLGRAVPQLLRTQVRPRSHALRRCSAVDTQTQDRRKGNCGKRLGRSDSRTHLVSPRWTTPGQAPNLRPYRPIPNRGKNGDGWARSLPTAPGVVLLIDAPCR